MNNLENEPVLIQTAKSNNFILVALLQYLQTAFVANVGARFSQKNEQPTKSGKGPFKKIKNTICVP
jgi:hypothetical protein